MRNVARAAGRRQRLAWSFSAHEQGDLHFLAAFWNLLWYQQILSDDWCGDGWHEWAGLGERRLWVWPLKGVDLGNDMIYSFRPVISPRRCSTSDNNWEVATADMVGVATSMTLSARLASFSRSADDPSPVDARIIQTLAGRRCRNSSRNSEPSVELALSLSNCCIRCKSWEGFLSPSSSEWNSCCKRRCSEAAVRSINRSLRTSYCLSSGGVSMRSLTSVVYCGEREATTWSNLVFCDVTPRVENWASTWANQTCGSAGQKGGILIDTDATVELVGSGDSSKDIAVQITCIRVTNVGIWTLYSHFLPAWSTQFRNKLDYTGIKQLQKWTRASLSPREKISRLIK